MPANSLVPTTSDVVAFPTDRNLAMLEHAHAPEAILAAAPRSRSRGFLITLALATLIPLIGVPLVLGIAMAYGTGLVPGSLALAAITGPMHVAATGFFYFDRDFRPVIGENRLSCLWALLLLPVTILAVGLSATAVIGPWAYLSIFCFHNTWLFYHYQRQNFGLASFISTHAGCGRLPPRVNTALNVAALGAIVSLVGTPGFYPNTAGLMTPDAYAVLRTAGRVIYVLSVVMLIGVFRSEPRLRKSALLTGALILGVAFFLPAVVFRSAAMAFLGPATAHGAQYILMMSVVSGRSSRGWLGLLTMCAVGATVGLVINSMTTWPAILLATGIVEVHFLIDAKVWRLREQRQRKIMNDRFDFLLAA